MEGETPREAGQGGWTSTARAWLWRDGASLLVLLLLAGGLRAWLFCNTEVAARDSIGFIQIAWRLQHQPWVHVLNDHCGQHPGYPVLLLLVSTPVRYFFHGPDALVMQTSAQLTSALAGTLLVIPMFYLGRELFSRTAGFWASVLFQVLPASCRVLSDGLSEATFLLFSATALYFAVRGLRSRSPWLFAWCGAFGALAYLTRPEGALIVGVTGAVLLAAQAVPGWRRRWVNLAACAASLTLVTAVVGSPIFVATGKWTIKTTPGHVAGPIRDHGKGKAPYENQKKAPDEAHRGLLEDGQPLFASLLAVWGWDPQGPHEYGYLVWGLWAVGYELNKGFHYATWLSALLGMWWCRERFRRVPGTWVLLLLSLVIILLLWRVAAIMRYLSDRHTLLVILCGSYCAAAALAALGERLAQLLPAWGIAATRRLGLRLVGRVIMVVLLAGLVGTALPRALETPHLSRLGFRAAGFWLSEHARPADRILDPYTWTTYYAGRTFHEEPADDTAVEYVVLDLNPHPHLPLQKEAEAKASHGTEVYRVAGHRRKENYDIRVYTVPIPKQPGQVR
jgi:4-amino-4-deoxy-L-arabinose transferase-like glycosyltransferase